MRTRSTIHRGAAFTLLELLVSIAILGAVFGLVGAMWGQAGRWNTDIERHADGLRLQRVLSMMKDQWADRRQGVKIGEKKSDVMVTDVQLSFTTASPILFPDWPLVMVTYRIEPERELGRAGLWRLVYEEARVASGTMRVDEVSNQSTVWQPGLDPRGRPVRDRMVLIDGMRWSRLERFGPDESQDKSIDEEARDRDAGLVSAEDDPSDGAPETDEKQAKRADRRHDSEDEGEQDDEPGLNDTTEEKLAKRDMWREMRPGGYSGLIPAVRLVGEKDKEAFACVFVILASR